MEDFFKKIFVLDWKKRMTFANMVQHPLLSAFAHEFEENANFYGKFEKEEKYRKD